MCVWMVSAAKDGSRDGRDSAPDALDDPSRPLHESAGQSYWHGSVLSGDPPARWRRYRGLVTCASRSALLGLKGGGASPPKDAPPPRSLQEGAAGEARGQSRSLLDPSSSHRRFERCERCQSSRRPSEQNALGLPRASSRSSSSASASALEISRRPARATRQDAGISSGSRRAFRRKRHAQFPAAGPHPRPRGRAGPSSAVDETGAARTP